MGGVMELLGQYGYLVVIGAVLAEQIGLPFPSEPFLLAAGGLIGGGHLKFGIVLIGGALASLVGDTLWYWIGRRRGPRVLGWLCKLSLERQAFEERFQSDMLLGELTWETSYGLPGEGQPPRVQACAPAESPPPRPHSWLTVVSPRICYYDYSGGGCRPSSASSSPPSLA